MSLLLGRVVAIVMGGRGSRCLSVVLCDVSSHGHGLDPGGVERKVPGHGRGTGER